MSKGFRGKVRRAGLSIVALLAGGTTFTSCDSKVKQAFTGALETTVLSIFDPATYINDGSDSGSSSLFDQ